MRIELPYPPPVLSPNARVHWAKKARAFKAYKGMCGWQIAIWMLDALENDVEGITDYRLTFCPPDKHRRDIDNAIASFKAGIDALSSAAGVDDSKFKLTFAWGESVKGGAVIVEAA